MNRKEEFTSLGSIVLVDGKKRWVPKSPAYFSQEIDSLPLGDGYAVTVSKHVATRSRPQLKYYMVLIRYIARHCGYSQDDAHAWVMIDTFGTTKVTIKGVTRENRRSISDAAKMSKPDCQRLIDHTLEICGDLEIRVPSMEELGYISNV